MKTVTFYQFMQWDGGDRHDPTELCFSNLDDMKKYMKGNLYDKFQKRTYVIYDSLEEYNQVNMEETKKSALAKLTDIEKMALGLL